jgi:DNA primase
MGKIPQQFIDELMARVDIVDVVGARLSLRKAGRDYLALCPFHSEKSPSFSVSQEKQFYYCFGCGAHGSAIGFLMDYDHMDFVEAVQELASQAGMQVPQERVSDVKPAADNKNLYELLEKVAKFYTRQFREHPSGDQAINYLKGRGLTGEIAARFGIGYAPPGWDTLQRHFGKEAIDPLTQTGMLIKKDSGAVYDRFRNRIMFPIRDRRGRVIGFGGRVIGNDKPKYLNSPETSIFFKGRELYGLYEAKKLRPPPQRLVVVEGYMDVVGLAQQGIGYAVATLGTATSSAHLEQLFRTVKEVVFCFDGDQAGRAAAWRALETALPMVEDGRQINFMFLPEGEDPDSLVRNASREDFEQRLVNSIPFSTFLLENFAKQVDLSNIDGRSRLVDMIRPYLQKLPHGVFRHLVMERLAEIVHMDAQKLATLINKGAQVSRGSQDGSQLNRSGFKLSHPSQPSLVRWAIRLLLYKPQIAQQVQDAHRFKSLKMPGIQLLARMIELLQSHPHYTCGGLLEHWRSTEEGTYLEKLVQWQPPVPAEGIETEFQDTLEQLVKLSNEQRGRELLEKSKLTELSTEEKLELKQLFNVS